jgi:hypothetical protein
MSGDTCAHDYPITCERAQALGLRVRTGVPEDTLE